LFDCVVKGTMYITNPRIKSTPLDIRPEGAQLTLNHLYDDTELLPYVVLSNSGRWKEGLLKFKQAFLFGLDIETTGSINGLGNGLNWFNNRIRTIQIYVDKETVLVLDLFEDSEETIETFLHILKAQLLNDSVIKVGQNIMFDLCCLRVHFGFTSRNVRDIRVMSIMRWCGIKAYRHSLAAIYLRLFNRELDKEEQLSDWWQPHLTNKQLNYAATDTVATVECYFALCQEIKRYNELPDLNNEKPRYTLIELVQMECNVIPAFVRMCTNGMPVNITKGYELLYKYKTALRDINGFVLEAIGLNFTAESLQLAKALHEKTGNYPLVKLKAHEKIAGRTVKRMETLGISIPEGYKITTEAANLFQQYLINKEPLFLYIALGRSLKKLQDTLCDLIESAEQNGGYAHTVFSSLAYTGTGRSSSSGGGERSTLIALNLQNIPNHIEHELLDKYELEPLRTVIEAPATFQLSINDLSSSHLRIMAYYSGEEELLKTMSLPDPHLRTVQILLNQKGREVSYEYCLQNKKTDSEIAHYRKISKTFIYSLANVAGNLRIQTALSKEFIEASLEDVKEVRSVMESLFPKLFEWQRYVHNRSNQYIQEIRIQGKQSYKTYFAIFKTPEGRLIHLPAHPKTVQFPTPHTRYETKISDVTSCLLLDKEANCVKKSLIEINDLLETSIGGVNLWVDLINFSHDEFVLVLNEFGKETGQECYNIWAANFTETLNPIPSGMEAYDNHFKDSLVANYSMK
jgi:DNA polymerase I-like protein with 3'-5' exonuclease and polymerase domains